MKNVAWYWIVVVYKYRFWVTGRRVPVQKNKKFILFNYPSKAWIPFINAPVCSVNDHPGEINPIN